jgi:hypothetical protein
LKSAGLIVTPALILREQTRGGCRIDAALILNFVGIHAYRTGMASIPNLSGGGVFTESRVVAIASRSAALALAVIAVALLGLLRVESQGGGLSAPVVNAFIAAPTPQAPVEVRRPQAVASEAVAPASSTLDEGDFEWPHLWTYDAQGRIVFRTDEQLVRCTNARRAGREEADCPSSFERTAMISSER